MLSGRLPLSPGVSGRKHRFAAWLCIALQLLPALGGLMALPAIAQSPSPFSSDNSPQYLASGAKTLGTALSDEHRSSSEALSDYARGEAGSLMNSSVEGWLNQFGTVQSQISLDEDFSLADSSLDWLIPLYDSPENILFTQLGARHKDDRNTLNLGFGLRHFANESVMYGINTFFDNDLSGHNYRLGLGGELWLDYLQLSGNVYQRLNSWHQSLDFADYDERPANGYDLRVKGFLPAYPQLGGKLVYEKYFGDDVALFGKDERQKDPYAVTMGVNYTPIPMITVGAEQRMGKSGQNDFNVNMQVTYQLDRSWSENVSPDAVDALRKLSHSRYDLVDRNNDIVLEYRKHQLLNLRLTPENIRGEEGSQQSIQVQLKSKYPLTSFNWTGNAFFTAGGSVTRQDLDHIQLILPPYKTAQVAAGTDKQTQDANNRLLNTYVLTASVRDSQGNKSSQVQLTVEVTPSASDSKTQISAVKLEDPSVTSRLANGADGFIYNATVIDAEGKPVAGAQVNWNHSGGAAISITGSSKTDGKGVATATLTSSAAASDIQVSASLADGTVMNADDLVSFSAQSVTVSGVVKNATTSEPVEGAAINAYIHGDSNPAYQTTSDANGNYSLTAAPGAYTIKVTAPGYLEIDTSVKSSDVNNVVQDIPLYPESASAQLKNVTLADSQMIRVADGVASFTYKATVSDAAGKPLANIPVSWSHNGDTGITLTDTSTTDASGIATATMTSTTGAEEIQVSASVDGGSTLNADKMVDFTDKFADVSGQVLNTLDNSAIAGATLKLYLTNNPNQPVFTTTTDSSGNYNLRIAQSTYNVKVTAPGYFDTTLSKVSYSAQSGASNQRTARMMPDLDVQARIVLTWNQPNIDLNARLQVPVQNYQGLSTQTVDFNKSAKPASADAVMEQESSSLGPETIAITKMHSGGLYTFNVLSEGWLMYNSGHVKLTLSDGRTFEFDLKNASGAKSSASLWKVFEIDTRKGKVEVKTINSAL